MEEVIAVSFRDRRRAKQAFDVLCRFNDKLDIELDDAVIVHRDRNGALEYDQDVAPTLDRGLLRTGLWGSLVGALAAVSFTVVADGVLDTVALGACALAGGLIAIIAELSLVGDYASPWKGRFGAPESVVQEIVDGMGLGDSAVVAWLDADGLETAASAFRGFGGKILRTTLPPEEAVKLEAVLRG